MQGLCLKIATVVNIHTVLYQVLELGVEDDYLRYNPSDNALKELKKAHNNATEKRRALTVPEQEIFEPFLKKEGQYHRWYPIFTVLLWTAGITDTQVDMALDCGRVSFFR